MSTAPVRVASPGPGSHRVVLNRRIRELTLVGASAVLPLVLALAISVAVPNPSLALLLALAVGLLGVIGLMLSTRYEITVMMLALYLGLLDGPVKLGIGGHETVSAVRDVLIGAVCLGAILRMFVRREKVSLPPLSAWTLAYVAAVVVEALNPNTHGIVKVLGGFRQLLEWVPFFFFGYAIMRSTERFRRLCIVLGVIALANGAVSAYQARLSPTQLASWGPGYSEISLGSKDLGGRNFKSEGVSRVRPPGLGSDAGFGGSIGVIALPATMALLAMGRRRRRWAAVLLCLGAMVAVATGLGRLQVIGAVIAVGTFAALTFGAVAARGGRRALRPLLSILGVLALALPAGAVLVSTLGSGTFSRYESIVNGEHSDNKLPELTRIPTQLYKAPFGVGLGVAGSAAGFGGIEKDELEGHSVSAETQYNFLADEVGLPGLALWIGLSITLLVISIKGMRLIEDLDLQLGLAAMLSAFVALVVTGLYGPTLASSAYGPFFWFFAGTAAYWFAGPGRDRLSLPRLTPARAKAFA
jgi:hypothetical protein